MSYKGSSGSRTIRWVAVKAKQSTSTKLLKKKKNRKYEFAEICQRNSPRERGVPFSLHDNDVININTVD